jgi:hypothetical protein
MFAAMGALQDWDGLFQFCYGEHPEDWSTDAIDGYFRMSGDPAKLALMPVAANLFRRGDVERATRALALELPTNRVAALVHQHGNDATGIWRELGVEPQTALTHRLEVGWLSGTTPHLQAPPAESTGQLPVRWGPPEDERANFVVDTEETKVLLGPVAGRTIELGDVHFEVGQTSNGYATVALTSMDGLPLARSRRMLLVAINRVENQDMGWDEERTTVGREWGHGPAICEGVPLTVEIEGRGNLRAWALQGDGTRGAEVDGRRLGPEHETVWYEVGE